MNQEKQERIKACLQELSTLLYEEADKSKLTDIEGVESAIKQIGARIKISGAQWNVDSVNQILSVRCAYLNSLLAV